MGETNMPNPAIVSDAPQTTVIFLGVIQGNCIGSVKSIGW